MGVMDNTRSQQQRQQEADNNIMVDCSTALRSANTGGAGGGRSKHRSVSFPSGGHACPLHYKGDRESRDPAAREELWLPKVIILL